MSVKKLLDLSGRVAVVTGGSRGLGLQMAEALAEMGAKLAITARKPDELAAAKAHLEAQGAEVLTVAGDLSKFDTIPGMVEQILSHYGEVDILVNNAGTTWGAPAEEYPLAAWQKVVDLNLTGLFLITQQIGKRSMLPRGYGRIVNIASVAGLFGQPKEILSTIAYNTTKGGLVNFTRALAAEWGDRGVTVNAICPGFFPSKMASHTINASEMMIKMMTPNGRIGGDEDLKGLAVLLASDASRHITGQAIAVDGGMSAI